MIVKNRTSGRILEVAINGKPWDFTKDDSMLSVASPETWLYHKSRVRHKKRLHILPNSEARVVSHEGYRRETKSEWSRETNWFQI